MDFTSKTAGNKLYDVKADHITVQGPNMMRRTFTTGYIENIRHSGDNSAKAYTHKLDYTTLYHLDVARFSSVQCILGVDYPFLVIHFQQVMISDLFHHGIGWIM